MDVGSKGFLSPTSASIYRLRFIAAALAVILLVLAALKCLFALLNPLLIVNADPGAKVFIGGQEVQFSNRNTGSILLTAWKPSYEIEVRRHSGEAERRTIYPANSDSPSVIVDKESVSYNLRATRVLR